MNDQIAFFIGLFDELLTFAKGKPSWAFRPVYRRTYITISDAGKNIDAEIKFKGDKLEVVISRPFIEISVPAPVSPTDHFNTWEDIHWHTKVYDFVIADPSFNIATLIDALYRGMSGQSDTLWSRKHLLDVKCR